MTHTKAAAKTSRLWKTLGISIALAGLLVLVTAAGALAGTQWDPGGVPVCTAGGWSGTPAVIADGAGGIFTAWIDERLGGDSVYAQRVDSSGKALWTANGVLVFEGHSYINDPPVLVGDGRGGIIVSWTHEVNQLYSVYGQRLNGAGQRLWAPAGVVIDTDPSTHVYLGGMVSDSAGGAIVVSDLDDSTTRANRINGSGTHIWGPVEIAQNVMDPSSVVRTSDGCIVGWTGTQGGPSQVFAQKIDLSGALKWAPGGVPLRQSSNEQGVLAIAADGANGAVAVWIEGGLSASLGFPADQIALRAQRVSPSGALLWGASGVSPCNVTSDKDGCVIAGDGSGGAVLAWIDGRSTPTTFTQKISAGGKVMWNAGGVAVYGGSKVAECPEIISDGSGGAIISYMVADYMLDSPAAGGGAGRRTSIPFIESNVYVQQILASGKKSPGWAPDGIPVTDSTSNMNGGQKMVTDGTGGAIVVFEDMGRDDMDLYAQRVKTTTAVWYLAEGSTAWGFGTQVMIENPNNVQVPARISYMLPGGQTVVKSVTLPPASQTTVQPMDDLHFETDFSTKVESLSGVPIGVDRTMYWRGSAAPAAEGHSSIGVNSPSENWFLPEGCSGYGFETWLLVQNPNGTEATCDFTYMIEGAAPKTVTKKVPANSRQSFNMADDIGQQSAATNIGSTVPVIVERSMYRDGRREGHESIGATSASTDYFLAEGSTAWGFTTYILVQNPNSTPCFVSLTYMTPDGPKSMEPFTMPGYGRATVKANDQVPNTDFSTQVHSDQPIIAERAMYWLPEDPALGEAMHDTIGMTCPASLFYFPDGESSRGRETFTLIQNPSKGDVVVTVTYMTPDGTGNVTFDQTIPAMSRVTLKLKDKIESGRASTYIQVKTAGATVMAERAMYWDGRSAGTSTIGGASD